jgi:transposase-like protein
MNRAEQADHRQEMFSIIRKYLESDMSARDYYRQHNLTEHAFYYWRRKYMDAHHPSCKGFVPVEVNVPAHPSVNDVRGDIQIRYPNGVQVTLDRSVSISRIKALIKAI